MKFNNIFKIIVFHFLFFIIGTILFILSFHTGLFKNIDIFFYRGFFLLFATCIVMILLLFLFKRKFTGHFWTYRDIVLSLVLIFCLNLVFFTHLPVTADRSISVFMLGYLNTNSDKSITNQEMTDFFTEKYLYEYGAMEKRLNEQIKSGNIIREKNGYHITKQGQILIRFYRFIANIFAIDSKLISPAEIQNKN